MSFWLRDATLVLGSNKYTLDGLNFSFEVPFEDSDEPPVATVKVMNLSENTRNGIKKNDPVILRVNPKFCVNSIWGANRAKFIQGGSRGIRLLPC